jgi:membrane-bound ClpP family serine protease
MLPILLVFVGLLLIVAEVYLVPGFNVVGIIGFLLIVFAVGYSFMEGGFAGGFLLLIGSVVAGGGAFYLLWQSGAWDRFVLASTLRSDEEFAERDSDARARYLGKTGAAVTPLRPTGIAEIDGERIEVVTEGEFIAAGSQVRVVAMDRRRYFVRLAGQIREQTLV